MLTAVHFPVDMIRIHGSGQKCGKLTLQIKSVRKQTTRMIKLCPEAF